MNKPRRLSGIVKNIADPIFGKKSMLFGQLISNWPAIAGDEVSSYALPQELKFSRKKDRQNTAVLVLAVTSARAQDILMQKDLLIEKLNQFMGFRAIEDIQVQHRPHKMIQQQKELIKPAKKLSNAQKDDIRQKIACTDDESLKQALEALGAAVYSRANNSDQSGNQT